MGTPNARVILEVDHAETGTQPHTDRGHHGGVQKDTIEPSLDEQRREVPPAGVHQKPSPSVEREVERDAELKDEEQLL